MLEGKKVTISVTEGGMTFEPLEDGLYTVQIVDVNLVEQFSQWKGKTETKLNYQFACLDEKREIQTKSGAIFSVRGRYLWKRCSPSMHEKSWLYKLVKAVLGREPTDQEKKDFDPESIIGKRVDVFVNQQPSKDGSQVYANIVSFAKASPKGCMGNDMPDYDFEAAKAKAKERSERTSQPIPEATKPKEEKGEWEKEMERQDNIVDKDDVDAVFGVDKDDKKKK